MKTLLLFFVSLALISFKPDNSKWLLVIHARSGSISNGVLKLNDPDKLVATFKADGEREAKALDLNQMILNWGAMFQSSPPTWVHEETEREEGAGLAGQAELGGDAHLASRGSAIEVTDEDIKDRVLHTDKDIGEMVLHTDKDVRDKVLH